MTVSIEHLHRVCRLCLLEEGLMLSLYELPLRGQQSLPERIMKVTNIHVCESDGLPMRICYRCVYLLDRCVGFKKQCEETDVKIRSILKKAIDQGIKPELNFGEKAVAGTSSSSVKNELPEIIYERTRVSWIPTTSPYSAPVASGHHSDPIWKTKRHGPARRGQNVIARIEKSVPVVLLERLDEAVIKRYTENRPNRARKSKSSGKRSVILTDTDSEHEEKRKAPAKRRGGCPKSRVRKPPVRSRKGSSKCSSVFEMAVGCTRRESKEIQQAANMSMSECEEADDTFTEIHKRDQEKWENDVAAYARFVKEKESAAKLLEEIVVDPPVEGLSSNDEHVEGETDNKTTDSTTEDDGLFNADIVIPDATFNDTHSIVQETQSETSTDNEKGNTSDDYVRKRTESYLKNADIIAIIEEWTADIPQVRPIPVEDRSTLQIDSAEEVSQKIEPLNHHEGVEDFQNTPVVSLDEFEDKTVKLEEGEESVPISNVQTTVPCQSVQNDTVSQIPTSEISQDTLSTLKQPVDEGPLSNTAENLQQTSVNSSDLPKITQDKQAVASETLSTKPANKEVCAFRKPQCETVHKADSSTTTQQEKLIKIPNNTQREHIGKPDCLQNTSQLNTKQQTEGCATANTTTEGKLQPLADTTGISVILGSSRKKALRPLASTESISSLEIGSVMSLGDCETVVNMPYILDEYHIDDDKEVVNDLHEKRVDDWVTSTTQRDNKVDRVGGGSARTMPLDMVWYATRNTRTMPVWTQREWRLFADRIRVEEMKRLRAVKVQRDCQSEINDSVRKSVSRVGSFSDLRYFDFQSSISARGGSKSVQNEKIPLSGVAKGKIQNGTKVPPPIKNTLNNHIPQVVNRKVLTTNGTSGIKNVPVERSVVGKELQPPVQVETVQPTVKVEPVEISNVKPVVAPPKHSPPEVAKVNLTETVKRPDPPIKLNGSNNQTEKAKPIDKVDRQPIQSTATVSEPGDKTKISPIVQKDDTIKKNPTVPIEENPKLPIPEKETQKNPAVPNNLTKNINVRNAPTILSRPNVGTFVSQSNATTAPKATTPTKVTTVKVATPTYLNDDDDDDDDDDDEDDETLENIRRHILSTGTTSNSKRKAVEHVDERTPKTPRFGNTIGAMSKILEEEGRSVVRESMGLNAKTSNAGPKCMKKVIVSYMHLSPRSDKTTKVVPSRVNPEENKEKAAVKTLPQKQPNKTTKVVPSRVNPEENKEKTAVKTLPQKQHSQLSEVEIQRRAKEQLAGLYTSVNPNAPNHVAPKQPDKTVTFVIRGSMENQNAPKKVIDTKMAAAVKRFLNRGIPHSEYTEQLLMKRFVSPDDAPTTSEVKKTDSLKTLTKPKRPDSKLCLNVEMPSRNGFYIEPSSPKSSTAAQTCVFRNALTGTKQRPPPPPRQEPAVEHQYSLRRVSGETLQNTDKVKTFADSSAQTYWKPSLLPVLLESTPVEMVKNQNAIEERHARDLQKPVVLMKIYQKSASGSATENCTANEKQTQTAWLSEWRAPTVNAQLENYSIPKKSTTHLDAARQLIAEAALSKLGRRKDNWVFIARKTKESRPAVQATNRESRMESVIKFTNGSQVIETTPVIPPITEPGMAKRFKSLEKIVETLKKVKKKTLVSKPTFQCQVCDKMFMFPAYLRKHMRSHSDERPYECNFCSFKFKNKQALRGHIEVIHMGVKFTCDTCGMQFDTNSQLNKHTRLVHLGERPNQCKRCGKVFLRARNLDYHLATRHRTKK